MRRPVSNQQLKTWIVSLLGAFGLAVFLVAIGSTQRGDRTYMLLEMNVNRPQQLQPAAAAAADKDCDPVVAAAASARPTAGRDRQTVDFIPLGRVVEQRSIRAHRGAAAQAVQRKLAEAFVGANIRQPPPPPPPQLPATATAQPAPETTALTAEPPADPTMANPHNFSFTILETQLCLDRRKDVFVLVIVHTAPEHYKRRMAIRETWASQALYPRLRMVVVFTMGTRSGSQGERLQMQILQESEKFRDIIQEDFEDSYRNLTYKAIMWMRWTSEFCANAPFVLKVDDDMFVNSFNLIRHVWNMHRRGVGVTNTISCLVWTKVKVIRDKKSKWYVSKRDYAEDLYPTYCSGSAYLMSGDVVGRMYNASFHVPFFWIDDFYVTGLLPRALGVQFNQLKSLYSVFGTDFAKHEALLTEDFKIFGHLPDASISQRYELWSKIMDENVPS